MIELIFEFELEPEVVFEESLVSLLEFKEVVIVVAVVVFVALTFA